MSEYNELGTGRFNRLLQRLLQVKSDPPVRSVAMELVPVLALETDAPEWVYLAGGRLMGATTTVAASGIQPSLVRVRNPAGSGVLVRLNTRVSTDVATLITVRRGNATANLGTVTDTIMSRDSRQPLAMGSAVIISSDNTGAAQSGTVFSRDLTLASSRVILPAVVLGPGGSIDIFTDNNVRINASHDWVERGIEESEV